MILMCPVCRCIFFFDVYLGDECPECQIGIIMPYDNNIIREAIDTSEEDTIYDELLKRNSKSSS